MEKIISVIVFVILAQVSHSQMISLEQYVTGLSSPTDIANAGDDRLFVVERRGKVKIIDKDGNLLETPFIDIDDMVSNASNQDERGMLGIAFHPDYANNGFFYLNHTDNDDHTNVVRYQVDPNNPNIANPDSRELIIKIEQPYWNHNGGGINFGPDGYLYIGMGDGGSSNDPQNFAQNKQSLLGKMLRLDVDNGLPYTIPSDNPFVGDDTTLDEIWALGMRNPWRFSFDKLTGDLWIGDVGQGDFEEVDFEAAGDAGGRNYGWRCYEGTEFTNNNSMADCNEEYTGPVFEFAHQGFSGPCSITGGYVYRGAKYPDLVGQYICTDYCSGDFYTVVSDGNGGWIGEEVVELNFGISTFGEDIDGELYVATLTSGIIYNVKGTEVVIPDPEYSGAESVEYDPVNNQWLVSNRGELIADNGEGMLSLFSNVEAYYGVEVLGDIVYAVTESGIVGVDLMTQEEVMNLPIPSSNFLNGITNDGDSKLYVTDFGLRKIYVVDVSDINNPTAEVLIEDTDEVPNGVLYDEDNNRLLYTTFGSNAKVKAVDLTSLEQIQVANTGASFIDGIDDDVDGNYYLSSWTPSQIIKYDKDFANKEILETPTLNNPSDIGISKELNMLAIPNGTSVIFVQLESVNTNDAYREVTFSISENPVSSSSFITLNLEKPEHIYASIFDLNGRFIKSISDIDFPAGESKIILGISELASGVYVINVSNSSGAQVSEKVIVK